MRTTVISTLLFVLFAAQAQAAAQKIAYVDITRALNEVEDGKAAKARLKKEFESKQKKLDAMQTEIKKKKDAFEQRKAMMKAEARMQKQEELQIELMTLQQTYMQLQQELMAEENKVTAEINERLRKIIDKIGDRDGYTLIMNIGDTVLYYKKHQDLTDQVVREYNDSYGRKK